LLLLLADQDPSGITTRLGSAVATVSIKVLSPLLSWLLLLLLLLLPSPPLGNPPQGRLRSAITTKRQSRSPIGA